MTQGLLISRNTREDLGKSYANCKTEEAKYLYTEYDRVYKRVLNASKTMTFNKMFEDASGNPRAMWQIIKDVTGTQRQKEEVPERCEDDKGH